MHIFWESMIKNYYVTLYKLRVVLLVSHFCDKGAKLNYNTQKLYKSEK